jgi:metal-responsive CopG/Arc/MetJ family transcriptional regulator
MKTVQMTLDADLINAVDQAAKKLHTNRSAFTRKALQDALNKINTSRLEHQHKKGYELYPAKPTEFSVWEKEQTWGDA